jgi:thiol-disulfide isomerase/thioredoxin
MPVTPRRPLASRWALALGVAVAIAMWPACRVEEDAAEGLPVARLDYILKDMHDREVRLEEFKGRPLIINFWATWCTPCKHEIPIFVELVDKYREQGFTVLGISTDDKPDEALRQFAADYKINYPVLIGLGHDELQERYDALHVIPISWFVRADGSIMRKLEGSRPREWFEEQVKQLIASPAAAPGEVPGG